MAVRHGHGKIAGTDALVFAYDVGDTVNSYKGEPTENLFIDPHFNDVANNWGNVTQYNSGGIDGGAYGGSSNTWSFKQNVNIISGEIYTIKGYVRMPSNNANVRIALDNSDLGNVYVDTAGEWTYFEYTTPPATSTRAEIIYILDSSKSGNEVQADKFQLEQKDHATPFVNGVRSSTEGIKDLTGKNTIDISNVSFDSNAQMEFDGTDDKVELTDNLLSKLGVNSGADNDVPYSMECVFKINSNPSGVGSSGYSLMGHASSGGIGLQVFDDDGGIHINFGYRGNSNYTFNSKDIEKDKLYHVVCTRDYASESSHSKCYINGNLEGAVNTDLSVDNTNDPFQIGAAEGRIGYLDGSVYMGKIYSRALTSQEVLQNYRHYKTRFKI